MTNYFGALSLWHGDEFTYSFMLLQFKKPKMQVVEYNHASLHLKSH